MSQPFETLHPAVVATYFGGVVLLTAFAMQPVLVGLSLAGALLCCLACMGPRAVLRQLRWQLPCVAVVCLANPLFSHSGATTLFAVGPVVVRGEALVYGLCMGALLVATVVWLEGMAAALDFDRMLSLGGGAWPTVALMLSMALQLVPQLLARAQEVRAVERACTAAWGTGQVEPGTGDEGHAAQVRHGARLSGVLLSWSLEDSVGRADVMRARGWRSGAPRTSYRRERFGASDACAECAVLVLLVLCALVVGGSCAAWSFYPTLSPITWWWGYVAYAALMLLPSAYAAAASARWRAWEAVQ